MGILNWTKNLVNIYILSDKFVPNETEKGSNKYQFLAENIYSSFFCNKISPITNKSFKYSPKHFVLKLNLSNDNISRK